MLRLHSSSSVITHLERKTAEDILPLDLTLAICSNYRWLGCCLSSYFVSFILESWQIHNNSRALFFIHNAFKATQARKSRITSIPLNFLWTLNSGPCFLSQSSVKYWWTAFSLHKNGLRFFKSPWRLYTSALCLTAQSDLDTAAVVVKLVVIHY